MEENMITPAEINSIAYLNKKRKVQAELLEVPLRKHMCCGQRLKYEVSPDLIIEPKKVRSCSFARGVESIPESVSNSHDCPGDADSYMSSNDDIETSLSYPKMHTSAEPPTPSTCWDDTSSQIGVYSLESRSESKASCSKSESTSMFEELHSPHNDYGVLPSDNYEDHLLEFGGYADCSFSEYQKDGVELCTDKDLEDVLYSNGLDASNYVLSSGADSQEGTKKLTIDKEFEEYFSMLMM